MKGWLQNGATSFMLLLVVILSAYVIQHLRISTHSRILSRHKRLVFLTSERRLALPPGTVFSLTPTLNLPIMRNAPTGYGADMLLSVPLIVGFDDLGLTSEENPWGLFPFLATLRKRRDTSTSTPMLDWSAGDRKTLYETLEGVLLNMGINGAPCLHRAICEHFQSPLNNHGFFGEMLELIFSASQSADETESLNEYRLAEKIGRTTGNCHIYYDQCQHSLFTNASQEENHINNHDRQKRFVYLTAERRLTFPPTTLMFLTPRLDLPGIRTLSLGYGSGLAISIPIALSFDSLGLTSEENPFGNYSLPEEIFRKKREAGLSSPTINWSGGDRQFMFRVVENTLSNIGMNGKACLLRATCEMFQSPLDRYGVLGEALQLFFSASKSPYSEYRLEEYVTAEMTGKSSGDCTHYHHHCPHSLFTNTKYQHPTYDEDFYKDI